MALILCHGGMYSGKSNMAISTVRSYSRDGLRRVLYQPKKNTRDVFHGDPVWFSRAGGDELTILPAKFFESARQVLSEKDNYDVFGFEEWQMYPQDMLDAVSQLHKSGKFVVAAGLDYYFNGEIVENFDKLRSINDAILLPGVSARCQGCYENGLNTMAVRTQRTFLGSSERFDANKIVVDGSEGYDYRPACFEHWKVEPPKDINLLEKYNNSYLKHIKTTFKQ